MDEKKKLSELIEGAKRQWQDATNNFSARIAGRDTWVRILTAERYKSGEVIHWMPLLQPTEETMT